jgi:release factor glutamine methyltransferase
LDLGTGSGCIAISLAKSVPNAAVTAVDISKEALDTAMSNASLNQVDIRFIEADILRFSSTYRFDIIVSNPPYIGNTEKSEMHANVVQFEPHLALFVADERPLIFYEAIADFALDHLSPGGLLFFEINARFGTETVEMLAGKGFSDIELRKDMQGNDRMIKASFGGGTA